MPARFDRRPLQEVAGRLFQQEQRSELSLERGIARAQLTEKHLPVRRRQLQGRLQQAVELPEYGPDSISGPAIIRKEVSDRPNKTVALWRAMSAFPPDLRLREQGGLQASR